MRILLSIYYFLKVIRNNEIYFFLLHCNNSPPYIALESVYPNKFKQREFRIRGMWQGKKGKKLAREATRGLIEEKLKISQEDIPLKVSSKTFIDNGLGGMLSKGFDHSLFRTFDNAYPNRFKKWQFKVRGIRRGVEGQEIAIESTKWLIEKILRIHYKDIPKKIDKNTFIENGLGGMLNKIYNDSVNRAIMKAYPDKLKVVKRKLVYVGK